MRRLTLMLLLLLPSCTGEGPNGLPVPPPMDMTLLERTSSPHDALAAPPEFKPPPDIFTRAYSVPPERLYRAIRQVALAQPRTYQLAAYDDRRQVHYVQRSRLLNFPDIVTVQVTPDSRLIMWSRSSYGYYDFNVNLKRLEDWQSGLDKLLPSGNAPPSG